MRDPNRMSYGQYLDVGAWQRAGRREFLPMKLFVASGTLAVALMMGSLCAGWFTMLLLGMDRETILTELTGSTYFSYWQTRHAPDLAAQAGLIWKGGALGYGAWLLAWSVFPILPFWPTLRRNETLVAERDPLPLPDPSIRVRPALQDHYVRDRPYLPSTEQGTLITVSKPSQPDRLHDLNLQRMMRVTNERTVRELGPLPAGGLPIAETIQKSEVFEQQHQTQVAQWQEQQRQSQSHGRSMA